MVKAIYLIKRKRGMELEAFRNYWITIHAGLALKVPGLAQIRAKPHPALGLQKGRTALRRDCRSLV